MIAEGNINTPAKLKRVLELGAFCAVVGSALQDHSLSQNHLQMLSNKSIFKRIMYGLLCKSVIPVIESNYENFTALEKKYRGFL